MTTRKGTRAAGGLAVLLALATGAAACGGGGGGSTETGGTAPVIDVGDGGNYKPAVTAADFVTGVDNPYMPLAPGAVWEYVGKADGTTEHNRVAVTDKQRTVMGVPVVVVRDTVRVKGKITEDTYDWFAQDKDGNVWYLGEDTKEYDGDKVSTKGSWEAGVGGAQPGIVMPAHPETGHAYRQEYLKGEAEDMAEVTAVDGSRTVDGKPYGKVVATKEWTPLDAKVVEAKWYAPGVGVIEEGTLEGGNETSSLVSYTPGS
jgi:hypothetical protein